VQVTANLAILDAPFPRHQPIVPLPLRLQPTLLFLPARSFIVAPLALLLPGPLLHLLLLEFASNPTRSLGMDQLLQVEELLFPLELFPLSGFFLLLEDG